MEIIYEEITNISNEKYLLKTDEGGTKTWVPCNLANADYQRYLRWLEDPNAEEVVPTFNLGE